MTSPSASGEPTDVIVLKAMRVMAFCGVLPEEKARRQPFEINVEISADLSAAGQSDDLNDTIDYGAVTDRIGELVEAGRFDLLEYFSSRVAEVVLADPLAIAVTVEINKLRPPVTHDLASSGVRITRHR